LKKYLVNIEVLVNKRTVKVKKLFYLTHVLARTYDNKESSFPLDENVLHIILHHHFITLKVYYALHDFENVKDSSVSASYLECLSAVVAYPKDP